MDDDRHAVFPQITFFLYIGNGSQEQDISCQKKGAFVGHV